MPYCNRRAAVNGKERIINHVLWGGMASRAAVGYRRPFAKDEKRPLQANRPQVVNFR